MRRLLRNSNLVPLGGSSRSGGAAVRVPVGRQFVSSKAIVRVPVDANLGMMG